MDEITLTLNSPITEEQWDMIEDVDFDHTSEITFHTKHGKVVKFVKSSAQPEIIRCKDCDHWMPYDWMFSEVRESQNINDYPEDEFGCVYRGNVMHADDFCSKAERRADD